MIGKKVKLKADHAKWYLDNPDISVTPDGTVDDFYESETMLHLVCCLGEPVYGKVVGFGHYCYRVKWRVGRLSAEYNIDRKDFVVVK